MKLSKLLSLLSPVVVENSVGLGEPWSRMISRGLGSQSQSHGGGKEDK
jgi:hypothetical protein